MITIEQIKRIADDIKADDEWVNDSHTSFEHQGVKQGLDTLIRHLEELERNRTKPEWWDKAEKELKGGYWWVKLADVKFA